MNSPRNSIQVFLPNTIHKPTTIAHQNNQNNQNNTIASPIASPIASTPISFLATMTMVPR
jgi:hypothetical protein